MNTTPGARPIPRPITEADNLQDEWMKQARFVTLESLPIFLKDLTEAYGHDYGTICHAVAAACVAAGSAMNKSPVGGITGMQASFVMWAFCKAWMQWGDEPRMMRNYQHMLYPQYAEQFAAVITQDTWEWLQKHALHLLASGRGVPAVRAHWQSILDGTVPFGYQVADEKKS